MRRNTTNASPGPAPRPPAGPRPRFGWWKLALAGSVLVAVIAVIARSSAGEADRARGLAAAAAGDFATAEPLLRKARDADPKDPEVVQALAGVYGQTGRGDEADAEYVRWIDLKPDDATPAVARFRMWIKLRHNDRAAVAADQVLQFRPADPELSSQVVAVYLLVGRTDDAIAAARAGLAVAPGHVRLRFQLAEALHAQGRSPEARDLLAALTAAAPDYGDAWRLRGLVAADTGDPAAAVPFLERAVALKPADLPARYALGQALGRCGREADAVRELDRFEKARHAFDLATISWSDPDRLDLGVRTAAAMFAAGLDADGHTFVQQVLDRDPTNAAALRLRETHRATLPKRGPG